jgi:murein DD-endopeptidase MepM/ murein hydrolase activator NlpD
MRFFSRVFRVIFGRFFQKRSIIIISEHRTNHIALSASLQFLALLAVIACVGWASYSTGSYMAAQTVLEEKDQTIKSVTGNRVETNFSMLNGNVPAQKMAVSSPASNNYSVMTDPSYALAALPHDRLFARIAFLENKVRELRDTNSEIIQSVRLKTSEKLVDMEEIIRQTGLNADSLRQQAMREKRQTLAHAHAQGGPFIPADTQTAEVLGADLDHNLERLSLLSDIVGSLPLARPLKNAEMRSSFGRRSDPFTGRLAFHAGLDMAGPVNAKVHATADGTVVTAGRDGAYGNAVEIDHGLGITTKYAHMSAILVREGQKVSLGDVVGLQGSTGRSTGPHVHYEVRYDHKPLDPLNFLNAGYHVSQIN